MKIWQNRKSEILCAALAALLASGGCSTRDWTTQRIDTAHFLANPVFMRERHINAGPFVLTAFERVRQPGGTADLYIEGDGLAWVSRSTPSLDPTPINPVGLQLATRDLNPNVIYLARPCQYTKMASGGACPVQYWTSKRLAPEALQSMDAALDDMKQTYGITGFNLIGYSGGAAIAMLMAEERTDVLSVRTVAGNIDTALFSKLHDVSLMYGSYNPADTADRAANIPQHHFIGSLDQVVPLAVYDSFKSKSGPSTCIRSTVVVDADHETGWVNKWPDLLQAPLDCNVGVTQTSTAAPPAVSQTPPPYAPPAMPEPAPQTPAQTPPDQPASAQSGADQIPAMIQ